MHYLKIFSAIWINDSRLIFDYDRQEDEPDEYFRYEYIYEIDDDATDEEIEEFGNDAKQVVQELIESAGEDKFYYENQTGTAF